MSPETENTGPRAPWRAELVWAGVTFAVLGFLGEHLVGSEHAFEYLMLFGGLLVGMGAERMRAHKALSSQDK